MKDECRPSPNSANRSLFVGRVKESERIRKELSEGNNLVLTGPFGIGRTALLRHLAKDLEEGFRFIFMDGSQTPGRLCEQLLLDGTSRPAVPTRNATVPWKIDRHRLETRRERDPRTIVLVLDDLAKVTAPKLDFLRWLNGLDHYKIVAVTERFLLEKDLARLRRSLFPAPIVTVGPLSMTSAERFFGAWALQHGVGWSPEIIHGLVLATRGYPTGMWEAARAGVKTGSGLNPTNHQHGQGDA